MRAPLENVTSTVVDLRHVALHLTTAH